MINFLNRCKNNLLPVSIDGQIAIEKRNLELEVQVSVLTEKNLRLKSLLVQLTDEKRKLEKEVASVRCDFLPLHLNVEEHSRHVALNG